MLERPELRQLSQRIVARYHLGPLTKPEVAAYVRHRLEVSGARRTLFPAALMGRLYRLSGGVPRVINVLCDRALLGTYVQGKERVDRATLAQAAREVFHLEQPRSLVRPLLVTLVLVLGALLAMTLYQLAFAALFRAWGADYAGGDACREAESLGLRCRSARAGLDELRRLNRPAVLLMRDDQGQEFHAALVALDDKIATFSMGAETRAVGLGALAAQWAGQYTVLWRMPPDARESIRPGERGPAVQWLMRQLAQAQGRVADAGKDPLFDSALERQVKQFQLAQGLIPDGAVGPQTVMRLAGVGDQAAPKLLPRPEGQ